jgi:NAD(P)H dehydrogenase (quinone)
MAKVAVIYYSSTGNVHALAEALASGAADSGAAVRLRRVPELAPPEVIDRNPAWRAHADATADVREAAHDDLRWADAFAFGTPTRYGNVSAQLKQFLDATAALWGAGELSDKPATGFTSAINRHGGNEATLLALYTTMYHWGAIVIAPGYTHPAFSAAGGNPYGTAHPSGDGPPQEPVLEAAYEQGARLARIAERLRGPRPELAGTDASRAGCGR